MAFPKRKNFQDQEHQNLVIIGSRNPVKLQSTDVAFQQVFGKRPIVQSINVDSGVGTQPHGDNETFKGAFNRAMNAKNAFPEADFWVGIEGGVEKIEKDMASFAWVFVIDKHGNQGKAKTATFYLPLSISSLVNEGMELGEAGDQFFNKVNSKQAGGTVGILTNGVVDRFELYKQGLILSLIPFIKSEMFNA